VYNYIIGKTKRKEVNKNGKEAIQNRIAKIA
jgi:hypothetical protein